ncbi:MAG: 8-oxoguanine DNA glycosylase, N-terminal domain-containing protein, partial [Oscillospiraceae bacterium]|nr:8-oxoguanine DNA glycosylase, N-terminal domain-containing protein [Oscillospiraceae bacterium]
MKILYHTNEIEVRDIYDFDLNKTLECGQCFRWNYGEDGVYTGVAFYRVLRLRQEGHSIFFKCSKDDFDKIWYEYFDLGRDYSEINKQLRVDDFMRSAIDYGAGIRILKQDAWEVLISFIISQNNHIPR